MPRNSENADNGATTQLSFASPGVDGSELAAGVGGNVNVKTINAGEVRVRVERVHVDGVSRTKDEVLVDNSYVKDLLAATNLQETIFLALLLKQHYDQLGIFRKCKIFIDTSKGGGASADGVDVTYRCRERPRVGGGLSTAVTSANEPSVSAALRLANVTGRAESAHIEYSYGSKRTQNFQATLTKPVLRDLEARANLGVYQASGEYPWSGYREASRGAFANLSWSSLVPVQLSHTLQWEAVWRNMAVLGYNTPFSIRSQCGHTLKEAIKYSVGYDSRDNEAMPTGGGWMWRLSQEVAGLFLGNVSYLKSQLESQYNQPLPLGSLLQGCVSLAQLSSWDLAKPPSIIDQYHLGGPLTFRGFQLNAIGCSADGFSPGANTYWNAGLHLYTPLPFRPGKGGFGDFFKTHLFLNAGNLRNIDRAKGNSREELRQLFKSGQVRVSCGAGVVFVLGGVMRLELNYCVPMASQPHDKTVHGFQFGIGASYT